MKGLDQRLIELQQRFTAGAYNKLRVAPVAWPVSGNAERKISRRSEFAASGSVGSDEIGIAERAHRLRTILFVATPQIAARKTAEHRRAPGLGAFALQRVVDLLDAICHRFKYQMASNRQCRPVLSP